jgi:hypothetical protein
MYHEQVQRIKEKLAAAKLADEKFQVFGASSHRYTLSPPASEETVTQFESDYGLSLPTCYRTFITEIGNGGESFNNSAAGPYYGIYMLGGGLEDLLTDPKTYLSKPVRFTSSVTPDDWNTLVAPFDDEEMSNAAFGLETNTLFQGILPIASQGCTYVTALVLNGTEKGKVVNADMDQQMPQFCFEVNFLDWYERWLDEVISGDLITDKATWFGYTMGGTDTELITKYQQSSDTDFKAKCISGLFTKKTISSATINIIETEYERSEKDSRAALLQLLTKHDYARAKPKLKLFYADNPLAVFQCVFWYAKPHADDWIPELTALLSTQKVEKNLFDFAMHVLRECHVNLKDLVSPFATNETKSIRDQALYTLKQLKQKFGA